MSRRDRGAPRVRRCLASRGVWVGAFFAAQVLLSACGLSELEGLSAGSGKNAGGSAQTGGPAGGAGDSIGGAGGESGEGGGGGDGGNAGSGTGGEDGSGETGGGDEEAATTDGQADASMPTDGGCSGAGCGCGSDSTATTCDACTGAGCMCPLGLTGPRCDTTGLVLYWKLDETNVPITIDSSGNGLDGTYVSAGGTLPTPAPGIVPSSTMSWNPGSLSFQSGTIRQAVQLASTAPNFSLVKLVNNFTISVWYRSNAVDLDTIGSELVSMGDNYIIRLGKATSMSQYRVEFNKHVMTVITDMPHYTYTNCWYVVPFSAGVPPFLDGNWHHVAITSTSAQPGMAIYLDGTLVPCTFTALNNPAYAAYDVIYDTLGPDFWVARHGNGRDTADFQGNIDEVRVYSRVLSLQEISALATGTRLPP